MKKIYFSFLLCAGLISGGQWSVAQNQSRALGTVEEQTITEKMKSDGATAEQVKMFIDKSNNPEIKNTQPSVPNVSCDNGFENGFNNWIGYIGITNGTLNPTWTSTVIASPNHKIVTYGDIEQCDNILTSIPLPAPNFGDSTARLGDPMVTGCVTERLVYSFTVNPSDTSFLFTYATIIQDAGHAPQDQPFFHVMILDQTGDTIPNSYYYYIGGPNPPGFDTTNCGFATWFKKWTLRGVNLTPYVGQQVTFVATNADCNACGHFAHSYVDFDCDGILISPRYCQGGPVTLNARSEPNSQYLWEDASTTEAITITNPTAGDTISCWVTPWGGYTFRANYVLSPAQVNFSYLVNGSTINFTDLSSGAVSYNWDFGDGNFSTLQNPSHTYTANGTYTVCLTIIASAGCNITYCDVITLTTGISEAEMQSAISLVPNPASDFVMLEFGNSYSAGKVSVEIYNLVGEKINSAAPVHRNGKYYLNVSALPQGIYFAKITTNKGTVTKSLAVVHK